MKKYFLAFSISAMSLFAEQVSVSLPDAININHKLIKDLYLKYEKMESEILDLKKSVDVLKNEKSSYLIKKDSEDSGNYFVSYEALNIRDTSNIKKSKIVGQILFGEIVSCKETNDYKDWCKVDDSKYIYMKGLSKIDNKLILATKDTNLFSGDSYKNIKGVVEKGAILSSKGNIGKKWYVLQNNLLIKKTDVIETSKGN